MTFLSAYRFSSEASQSCSCEYSCSQPAFYPTPLASSSSPSSSPMISSTAYESPLLSMTGYMLSSGVDASCWPFDAIFTGWIGNLVCWIFGTD